MSNLLAFPMYAVDRADTRALWLAVKGLLAARGVPVEDVPDGPESDLLTHWRQPALILSQACGYPLVTAFGRAGRRLFSLRGPGLRRVPLPQLSGGARGGSAPHAGGFSRPTGGL